MHRPSVMKITSLYTLQGLGILKLFLNFHKKA